MQLSAETLSLDKLAIEQLGIPELLLMDAAGRNVAVEIVGTLSQKHRVIFWCGTGNNGGDGFAAARYLAMLGPAGLVIELHVIGALDQLKPAARQQLELLQHWPAIRPVHHPVPDTSIVEAVSPGPGDLMVDALFGMGLSRPLENGWPEFIAALAAYKRPRHITSIAIDVPTGLNPITGQPMGALLPASTTVTFSLPKPGLYFYPGKAAAGKIVITPIGLPPALLASAPSPWHVLTPYVLRPWLPQRAPDGFKNRFGHVLVVAGNPAMPGAAHLTAAAALATGAGLVTLASHPDTFTHHGFPPELLHQPFYQYADLCERVLSGKYQAIVLGPGLGYGSGSPYQDSLLNWLGWLAQQPEAPPVVVDADGLNALADASPIPWEQTPPHWIFTPHIGEFGRLSGLSSQEILADLPAALQAQPCQRGQWVLKSATTVVRCNVADEPERYWVTSMGNAGMATGGSGDVLTGMLGGWLAQGVPPHLAAPLGVGLHGLAGDAALAYKGSYAMVASDLIHGLPLAIARLTGQTLKTQPEATPYA